MPKKVTLKADVETSTMQLDVTAAPGSAGTVVSGAISSSSVTLSNVSTASAIQYKVDTGAWEQLGRDEGISLPINLMVSRLYLRRATHDGGPATVLLLIDGVTTVKAAEIAVTQLRSSASPASPSSMILIEGMVLQMTGSAGASGAVQQYDATGAPIGAAVRVGVGPAPTLGPFPGTQKMVITCTAGSIDAVVVDAALGIQKKVKADAAYDVTSGLRVLGGNTTATSGAGAGTGRIFDTQHPALSEYYAIAVTYANFDTAAPMRVNGAKAAACPDHLRPNVTALAWGAYLLVNGAQAFDVPVAVTGVSTGSANLIPGFITTDKQYGDSIARTDGGIYPLTRVRSHINDAVYPLNLPGTLASYNALVGTTGLQYGAYSFPGTLTDITTSGAGIAEYGGSFEPVAIKYFYYKRTIEIACGGDSLTQGVGTMGSLLGWPVRLAMMNSPDRDFVISPTNLGVSGQKLEDSHATLLRYCAVAKPTHAALFGFSPNNAVVSAAAMNALWRLTMQTIDSLIAMGIKPVLLTSPPVDGYNAADKALLIKQNTRIMALPDRVTKVDVATALTLNGNINPAYSSGDGTHWNDAGYTLVASLIWSAVA